LQKEGEQAQDRRTRPAEKVPALMSQHFIYFYFGLDLSLLAVFEVSS
jgi:hypothetical protein